MGMYSVSTRPRLYRDMIDLAGDKDASEFARRADGNADYGWQDHGLEPDYIPLTEVLGFRLGEIDGVLL